MNFTFSSHSLYRIGEVEMNKDEIVDLWKNNKFVQYYSSNGVSNNGFECKICHPPINFEEAAQQTLTEFGKLMGDLNKQNLQVTYDRQFKVLYIIRGISSCGKTSLAQSLGFPYFEADQYFTNEKGEYKFDATKLAKAHNYCKANVEDAMIRGDPRIIQSNTNTRISEIQPYLDLAAKYNYKVFSLILEKRHHGVNQHGLKNEKLIQMAERLHSNIKLI